MIIIRVTNKLVAAVTYSANIVLLLFEVKQRLTYTWLSYHRTTLNIGQKQLFPCRYICKKSDTSIIETYREVIWLFIICRLKINKGRLTSHQVETDTLYFNGQTARHRHLSSKMATFYLKHIVPAQLGQQKTIAITGQFIMYGVLAIHGICQVTSGCLYPIHAQNRPPFLA